MNANAIINIAKSQLGLEEDDYRAVLERTTGKASLRLMTNPDKLKVIDEMKRLVQGQDGQRPLPCGDKTLHPVDPRALEILPPSRRG